MRTGRTEVEKKWWWAQSIPLRFAYPSLALCSALTLWPLLCRKLAREYTTTMPLTSSGTPIGFLCFPDGLPNYLVGVLMRGRFGGANGCPSLRLGWAKGPRPEQDRWGRSSHVAVGCHQCDRLGGGAGQGRAFLALQTE